MHQLGRVVRLLPLLPLLACAPSTPGGSYRRADVTIGSAVSLDPARLAGKWYEVAGLYDPAQSGCAIGPIRIAPASGGALSVTLGGCGGAGARTVTAVPQRYAGRYDLPLPGRLGDPWWVLWTDADYRVMVIGTPSGRFGAILGRTPVVRRDLRRSAERILDFNGYDIARLRSDLR